MPELSPVDLVSVVIAAAKKKPGHPAAAPTARDRSVATDIVAALTPMIYVTQPSDGSDCVVDWRGHRGPVLMHPDLVEANIVGVSRIRRALVDLTEAAEACRQASAGLDGWLHLSEATTRARQALDAAVTS